MSEERFLSPPHERLTPGDLVVSTHSFYDPPREPVEEHLAARIVYEPYCKLDGTAARFLSDRPCLVLAVEFIPVANEDVLLLLAQDGTCCGAVGYAWTDLYRKASLLQRTSEGEQA